LARNWTNDSGLALSASNLNALEADVTAALGVPDAALAARVIAGATKTALDAQYATNTALAGKEPATAAGTTSQYRRGDKTWQTLDKSAVGLSNVDNTSDMDKPVSALTQAAINSSVAPSTLVEGLPLYVYGNSYTVAPAVGRATLEWPQRLQKRLHMGALASNGQSGSVRGQIAYNLNNNVDGATPSRKWVTGSKGLVVIEESINDAVTFGLSAKAQTAYGMALRVMIELMRAATRKDATDAAITYTGTWTTGTTYLVNSGKKTSTVGDKASFSVTGDAVTVYFMGNKDATSYATADVKIGSTVIGTIDTRNQMDPYNAPGTVGTGIASNLCCTRITGMGSGAHTVDVVLTASVGTPMYFDGFSVPGTKPPEIILLKEGLITNYNPNGSSDARDAYNAIMETVAAEYPTFVSTADPGVAWDSSCLYMGDGTGNHPNDKGMAVLTDAVAAQVKTLTYRDGLHIL
jgi:lysophospholipase L1-like esterase